MQMRSSFTASRIAWLCWLLVVGCQLPVVGCCWLSDVVGCRLPVVGCWLLWGYMIVYGDV
jgi:hypothetical protein